jgi:hypothetical protein
MCPLTKRCLAGLLLILAGCSTYSGDIPRKTSLIPKGSLHLLPSYSITYAGLVQVGVLVAAVYYVTDPAAPVWEIVETRLPDDRVQYALNKNYFSLGGDGEARGVVSRRAEALAQEKGLAGFRIQRYEESIDSRILLPRRQVFAEVQLLATR